MATVRNVLFLVGCGLLSELCAGDFVITDFGAKADGSKCTGAFARAVAACRAAGGGRVVVPAGNWFSGAIRLESNVELHLSEGAEVLFSQDPADYLPAVNTSWEGIECWNYSPLVYAYCCTNAAITGTGTLKAFEGEWKDTFWYPWAALDGGVRDARRQLYDWGAKDVPVSARQIWKKENAHTRPHFVQFNRCRNVRLEGFKIRNSPFWTIHLYLCDGAVVRGLDVFAHGLNNDGIDIEMTRNVLVEDCTFDQGDDGVVIKSGRNRDAWRLAAPTENVLVRNCHIKDAHTVLGVGSEISGGVRHVRMENCRAETPYRVFYLKTNRRRGGFLEDIVCENVTCRRARVSVFEIATDVLYQWGAFPDYETRLTKISGIVARNLHAEETRDLIRLVGDAGLPATNVVADCVGADKITGRRLLVRNVEGFRELSGAGALVGAVLAANPVRYDSETMDTHAFDRAIVEVSRADRAADAAWGSLKDAAAVADYRAGLKARMAAAVGGFPEKTPLNVQVRGTVVRPGYRIEKLLFESRPRHYVTALLFVPDGVTAARPAPGVVITCGHNDHGKNSQGNQRAAVVLAQHGLVALIFDPIDQGERQQLAGSDVWSVTGHVNVGLRAHLVGWSAAQFRIWDGIRALDVLLSRPEVDGRRVGVTGMSGGGTMSAYLNAIDARYTAASPMGYITTLRALADRNGPQDMEQLLFGQLSFGLNHLSLLLMNGRSAVAPGFTYGDLFPYGGSDETYALAEAFYRREGRADRIARIECDGPHGWYESEKQALTAWMRRHLADDQAAWPVDPLALERADVGFDFATADAGLAMTPASDVLDGKGVMSLPGARSAYDFICDELTALEKRRGKVTPETVRAASGVAADPRADVLAGTKRAEGGVTAETAVLRMPDASRVVVRAFFPAEAKGAPVFLAADAAVSATRVAAYLAEGRAVAAVTARGFGGGYSHRRHSYWSSKGLGEELAALAAWMGRNFVADRAEDYLAAGAWFRERTKRPAEVVADGDAVVPAAHAFYLGGDRFASFSSKNAPASWTDTVRHPETGHPHFCNLVYGGLAAYDWTDLIR